MSAHLQRSFFQRDPVSCARELIGCTLGLNGCLGKIVETEAYAAEGDHACHTWKRPSARDFVARYQPGTAYVYLNYGMHWLFNLLVKGGEKEGFVLVRALEPIEGIESMQIRRKRQEILALCNGPGKLTQALGISGCHHGTDPLSDSAWILAAPINYDLPLVATTRIGISQAVDYPWRFLSKENRFVSIPDKSGIKKRC